jgi:glycosyltransferase involved in cell wall biosynthesis
MSSGRPAQPPCKPEILGLFPSFDSAVFGGVQAAGREAWQGIVRHTEWNSEAFFYEPGTPKLPAVFRAAVLGVKLRWGLSRTVLVWHCGLLKLAPFICPPVIGGTGSKRVLFLHGVEVWRRHDALTSFLMRGTDLFLSNSDHTWRRFLSFHPECAGIPHRTVHLGLGESLPAAPAIPEGPPAALMIGRMQRDESYKGHREMIEVWPRVLRSMPLAELWIVGGGDLRPELESLVAQLCIASNVRFFGAVPEDEKLGLLERCRALVLPSAAEGFGLVYLEAMRMGRPCIVSTLDAGAEVVNPPEAGLPVDLTDPEQVTDSVLRVLTSGDEWDEMAARAKQRYDSRFTGRHFQSRLVAALQTVTGP